MTNSNTGDQPMYSEVKIRESQYNELKQVADKQGITVREAVDQALTKFLKSTE